MTPSKGWIGDTYRAINPDTPHRALHDRCEATGSAEQNAVCQGSTHTSGTGPASGRVPSTKPASSGRAGTGVGSWSGPAGYSTFAGTPPARRIGNPRAWDEPGHAHFVTFSCHQRLPLLTRDRTRRWVIAAMQEIRQNLAVAFWAYVIVPEHVHVLLSPLQAHYEMRRILAPLKRPVSDAAREHLAQSGRTDWLERLSVNYPSRRVFRFWQSGGGYDQNIFREKTVPAVIEYIHANPVRRGMVKSPTDWDWSSARFWDGCAEVPLRMDTPFT